MLKRATYNVKIAEKIATELEDWRKKKEDDEGQPYDKTRAINYLVKKGLEAIKK